MSFGTSIILAAIAFVGAAGFYFALEQPAKRGWKSARIAALLGTGVFVAAWIGIYVLPKIEELVREALQERGIYYGWAVIIYGLLIAIVLYRLKLRSLKFYAVLEFVIGVLALVVFSQVREPIDFYSPYSFTGADLTAWMAGFAAPIYILIRSFTNFRDDSKDTDQPAPDAAAPAAPA